MQDHIKPYVAEAKQHLRGLTDVKAAFSDIRSAMMREVDVIQTAQAQGKTIIPEVSYASIADGAVSDATRADIRHRGCAIIRGVFDPARVRDWNAEVGDYIARNDYLSKAKEKAGMDTYFADLASGAPQIYGLYWSKPRGIRRWACHPIWIAGPMNAGSIRRIRRSMGRFLQAIGSRMTRGKGPIGHRHANIHRPLFVRCSARFRGGRR